MPSVEWKSLSIPKIQQMYRRSLVKDEYIH